uniref:GATA transcription factor n=1 Tax=Araucaria cunninghamii TaxID=56994 RepID=A0A0D6QVA9_ARACU
MDMMSYLPPQTVLRHPQQSQHEQYGGFETNSCEAAWGAAAETFRIDDLFDFTNDDIGGPIVDENTSVDSTEASASASASLDGNYSPENLPPATELCVPMDSLADLEWLSTFVEDSFCGDGLGELPLCNPAVVPSFDGKTHDDDTIKEVKKEHKAGNDEDARACSLRPWIPVRARRSKRSRTGGRVWTSCPLVPNHHAFESYGSLFTSSDSSSNSSTVTSSWPLSRPPLAKKHKSSSGYSRKTQEALAQQQPQRRCSHCLVQKTPQWRAGPLGPKTLCNACGVRFKSGRLLPEYRPAVSPTFLSDVHSNSHRKVLELRRQKEEQDEKIVFFHQHISQDTENPVRQEEEEEDRREEQGFGMLA